MQGGGACQHRPQGLVAASSAPASLLGLLNASGHASTVSACVATLNNLCASEEGADKVFEEAKRFAPHVSSRLLSSTSEMNALRRHLTAMLLAPLCHYLPWRHCTCEAVLGQAFHLKTDGICRGLTE